VRGFDLLAWVLAVLLAVLLVLFLFDRI